MTHPLSHFEYRHGALASEGVPLSEIAEEFGTPVYVYSAKGFLEPLRQLKKGLAGIDHLICFAVKSCSNVAILRMLADAGAGMDLVSGGELFRAKLAGVPSDRIVFSGVGKTPGEMAEALRADVFSFNVESVAELQLLDHVSAQLGTRARVALRFNPDVDAKTHPYISTGLKKNKFGLNRSEILAIVRSLRRYPHIDLRGISIHIGSQLLSLKPLNDAFLRLRQLVSVLEPILEQPLEFLDLGGGIGIRYQRENAPKISDYCKLIQKHFGPRAKLGRPFKILIEPGRTIAGNAGVLLTSVLYRKSRSSRDFLVLDAAMNDLLRPALYGSYHEIIPVDQDKAKGQRRNTDIVGPVCETSDCFARGRKLVSKIESGDLMAILSAGAYGFSMASSYNTRPRPPEVLIQNGAAKLIRERETYDDLVKGEKHS